MPTLSRYTSIPAALDTLVHRRISLIDPNTWPDRNDREMMAAYAAAAPHRRVFAYCMAEGRETAHHWQIYADGGRGARINFDQKRLIAALADRPEVRHDSVSYVTWRDPGFLLSSDRIPFIKRQVFRYEREYRIIATTPDLPSDRLAYNIEIPLKCITSVYISGELPPHHFATLQSIIRKTPGCEQIPVRHSGLLRNENWACALASHVRET